MATARPYVALLLEERANPCSYMSWLCERTLITHIIGGYVGEACDAAWLRHRDACARRARRRARRREMRAVMRLYVRFSLPLARMLQAYFWFVCYAIIVLALLKLCTLLSDLVHEAWIWHGQVT